MTRYRVLCPLVAIIAMATQVAAGAQEPSEPHQKLLKLALDNLQKALCGNGQPCAPATASERANPPVTDEQARAIVGAGTISVLAEHCGLDWTRRNFMPMMQYHRQKLKMNRRQMALVGLLHGITMGAVGGVARQTPCSPEMKASIEKRLIAP
jgi:hypothetical protein